MMRSVNDRYALLSGIGVENNVLQGMTLENSAWISGMKAAEHLRDAYGDREIEVFFDNLKKVAMPDWYKE